MRQLVDKHAWADGDADLVLTVAAIRGRSADDVVRLYGGEPGTGEPRTFGDAWPSQEDFGSYFHVQVQTVDQFIVALEPNGWTGDIPEIARRVSHDGGYFFSTHWSMSGAYRITEATNGAVTAYFDPFSVGYPGGMGELLPDWVEDAEFDANHPNASCFAALEQRTGLAFDQRWLIVELPTYRIPDPDVLLKGVKGARVP